MYICEYCSNDHDGSYASGRFCSRKCSAGFSTKEKRKEINEKVRKKHEEVRKPLIKFICLQCKKESEKTFQRREKKFCSGSCAVKWRFNPLNENNYIEHYSKLAKDRELGGLNSKIKLKYLKNDGTSVYLQSSYEIKLAEDLDKNKIEWIRPTYFNYSLNGKIKKYYPDFYIPSLNLYLDPKNDFLIIKDKNKIDLVQQQNNIKIFMLNKNQLTWEYIKELSMVGEKG